MEEKEYIERELEKLITCREYFLAYLDANIPKDSSGAMFDFSSHPLLDAKEVYEYFYKLDYQARKIRGFIVEKMELNP
ncbi:MAG: hypothetical protein PHN38_04600 [Sulfurospirillaceae bacterium]|nr:hypothetical protein [Sulfurospirillaceae bacterium]MDD3463446.1 hypothetical protein [Sulfurospirillaceae bacterium]